MLQFKPLGIDDRDVFLHYLDLYPFWTYEYSFITLFLWKDYSQVEYAVINDSLVIKKNEGNKGRYFMAPLGCSEAELKKLTETLWEDKQKDPATLWLFKDIEEPFLAQLKKIYGDQLVYTEDRDSFDYLYETKRLIDLSGEKLNKRKNQVHQFIDKYPYEVRDIHDRAVITDCLELSKVWLQKQRAKHSEMYFELDGIRRILDHLDKLNLCGMAVYVGGKIAGYTLGEKVNSRMAIIHVEKADTKYTGVYAFLNKTFAEMVLNDTEYINREEDLGLLKLKKAKQAYDPVRLEKKYWATIKDQIY